MDLRVFKGLSAAVAEDDLRPAMKLAVVDKGFLIATNGNILCKVCLKSMGATEEELLVLEGKVFNAVLMKKLAKAGWFEVSFSEGGITFYPKKGDPEHAHYTGSVITTSFVWSKTAKEVVASEGKLYIDLHDQQTGDSTCFLKKEDGTEVLVKIADKFYPVLETYICYPNYANVIPQYLDETIHQIGVNPQFLVTAAMCFPSYWASGRVGVKLKFSRPSRAIGVFPINGFEDDSMAIVMPLMLPE